MDNTKVTALKEQRAAFKANLKSAADQERYTLKLHDTDVIFAKDSLEEFIRLIQRQGINNLTIYSVGELLSGNKYQTVSVRYPPPNWPEDQEIPNEFDIRELKDRKNYFVFVRYSFCWEAGGEERENDFFLSNNEKNGRHVFVKTVNDIIFYKTYLLDDNGHKVLDENENPVLDTTKSSIFHEAFSDENPLPDIFQENIEYNDKNGTFTVTVDNIQYVIKIRGFNDDGEYIGKMKIDPNTDELGSDGRPLIENTTGYVLRGDSQWANSINNHWLPLQTEVFNLGSNDQKWNDLYLSGTGHTGSVLPNETGLYNLGAPQDRWNTVYANTGDFNNLTLNGKEVDTSSLPTAKSTSNYFWRGDGIWANELKGDFFVSSQTEAARYTYNNPTYESISPQNLITNGILEEKQIYNNIYSSTLGAMPSTRYIPTGTSASYRYSGYRFISNISSQASSGLSYERTQMQALVSSLQLTNEANIDIDEQLYMYEVYVVQVGQYVTQQIMTGYAQTGVDSNGNPIYRPTYTSQQTWSVSEGYYLLQPWSGTIRASGVQSINQLLTASRYSHYSGTSTSYYASINSILLDQYYIFNTDNDMVSTYLIYDTNNSQYYPCELQTHYPIDTTFYIQHTDIRDTDDPAVGLGYDSAMVEGSIRTLGGISARKSIKGYKVYAAVFNDYAECRKTINLEAGRVVVDNDDGTLACASQRLQPGAQVISDTYGHLIGEMPGSETPLAVSGRVLVYTYQPRENYHAGMAVCSAPDGTVDIMTREEIKEYPDCIIGIVSEIPQYEKWGSDQVNVDGRIWIKVK